MSQNTERRDSSRSRTVYLPSCIYRDDRVDFAIMRDRSESGAGFSAETPFKVGQRLRYSTGDDSMLEGIVRWCEGGKFGVERTGEWQTSEVKVERSYRSVRIPLAFPVDIRGNGIAGRGHLANISQMGAGIEFDGELPHGSLVSLSCFGALFEAATVKWSENGRVGLRWNRPMTCKGIAHFLESLQGTAGRITDSRKLFA